MKKITIICLFLLTIISIISCNTKLQKDGNTTSGNDSTITQEEGGTMPSDTNSISIPLPFYDGEEEKAVADLWKARAERIVNSDKMTKVEYIRGIPLNQHTYSSEDSSIIQRWKSLILKFRCSVVPYELYVGGGTKVTFYGGELSLTLMDDNPAFDIIVVGEGTNEYMLKIDNGDEVKDEFTSILSDMGVMITVPETLD